MRTSPAIRLIPMTLAALAALALFLLVGAGEASRATAAGGGGSGCAHADDPAVRVEIGALRKAMLCLVNDERRRHARKPLDANRLLQKAAAAHTQKMVETGCLAHRCPGEPTLEQRIRKAGYLRGARDWQYAENTGCARTAGAMIENWMASRFHRINVLRGSFRDLGVGPSHRRVKGRCSRGFATFTAVFAFRSG
jgi:uncharacterized protein YkwD